MIHFVGVFEGHEQNGEFIRLRYQTCTYNKLEIVSVNSAGFSAFSKIKEDDLYKHTNHKFTSDWLHVIQCGP